MVSDVEAGSMAGKAGLKKGDVLMEINRNSVSGAAEARELVEGGGVPLMLYVYRNGAYIYLAIE